MLATAMDFRLLGPLEVRADGEPVALGGPRQRAVLAVLLLNANRVVSRDALIEQLGHDDGRDSSRHALANQISRLRKALPEERLSTTATGHSLRVAPGELDVETFEERRAAGRAHLRDRRFEEAVWDLRRAEQMWRGPALVDVDLPASAEGRRLSELRVEAIEDRVEAELALGREAELAAELEVLVDEHPLRERLHGLLMLSRYRSGRQADALEAYRAARRLLIERAGVEPGVELRRLHEAILHQEPALDLRPDVVCPYKGLASYTTADAEYFCGRERLVDALIARLAALPVLAVVGPSGSGKSSLIRAGLLPALARGALPGSARWTHAVIRPGEVLPDTDVLVVDQFEELFTGGADEGERSAFATAVPRAARVVVIGLRADFYGECAAYPELAAVLAENHVLIGPPARDDLRRVIEEPARRVGLDVEPELVEALLSDVDGRPGSLPLLSTALLELWRERDGRRLRLEAYARSGGVHGAIARLAEDAFERLDTNEQALAQRLLLRLADDGEDGTIVRRRVALAVLEPAVAEVAAKLTQRRLLTVDDGAVELVHEALLTEWPRLRAWLEEDAHGRQVHRQLRVAARSWDAEGRNPAWLYGGARLAAVLAWSEEAEAALDATERAFLERCRASAERAQRRLRMVVAGVAGLLVAAVIAGAVALQQSRTARAKATTAAAQRLGAEALAGTAIDRSLLLARQAVALEDSPQTRGNLLAALLKSPAAIGVLNNRGVPLTSLALSPDGRRLAILDADSRVRLIDLRRRRLAAPSRVVPGVSTRPEPGHPAIGQYGSYLDFSPDGSLLAVGGRAPVILDARTLGERARLVSPNLKPVYGLRFTDGGRSLLLVLGGPADGLTSIERVDSLSGRTMAGERFVTRRPAAVSLLLPRAGRQFLVSSTDRSVLYDADTLRALRRVSVGAAAAALSPGGGLLLTGGSDGSVTFTDLAGGAVRTASGRHEGGVLHAAISDDGRTAVTAGQDNRLIVWDTARATARETLTGHGGQITGLQLSYDGRTLYTASLDGTVVIWDLEGSRRLGTPFAVGRPNDVAIPHRDPSWPVLDHPLLSDALSPDGTVLAVGQADGTVVLVDALTLRMVSHFTAVPRGPVRSVAYVPRTGLLAVGGDYGFLALTDPRSGRIVATLPGHHGTVLTPSFSADGQLMASVAAGDRVLLRSLRAGRPTGRPRAYIQSWGISGPVDVSLSPDGKTMAVTSAVGVEIVDTASLQRRARLADAATVRSLAHFTRDGRFLVAGSTEGWARLWSTRTWQPVTPKLGGHTGEVLWASTSPGGRTLATGSTDGTIRLFDLGTHQTIGALLPGLPNRPIAPLFTPDGHVLAVTNAGRAYRWDVRPSAWGRHACVVAGRPLTRAEWSEMLGDRPYQPACTKR
jgi:WD40 repeat protein/DNA-binding SARP family transcriptional activator